MYRAGHDVDGGWHRRPMWTVRANAGPYPSNSHATFVPLARELLMRMVNLSFVASVVNQRARLPMLAFGVSSTNEPEVTLTAGLTVVLVEPAAMVATPLVLKLRRPEAWRAMPLLAARTPMDALVPSTPVPLELTP